YREPLLQRVVEYAVTGLVVEIGGDDSVFVGQAGHGLARAEVERSPDGSRDKDQGSGNKDLPEFPACHRSLGRSLLARWRSPPGFYVALQTLQLGSHVGGVLITQLPVFLQRPVDNFFQLRRRLWIQSQR